MKAGDVTFVRLKKPNSLSMVDFGGYVRNASPHNMVVKKNER